ncbi:MAG: sensor histidine kinase [Archangium sp.]
MIGVKPTAMTGPRFISVGTFVATVAAIGPGFFQGLNVVDPTARAVTSAAVIGALLVSTAGMWWAERAGPRAIRSMLGVFGAFVFVALWFSNDRAFLVGMPFISMLVLFLPLWVALGVTAVMTLFMAWIVSREVEGSVVWVTVAQLASAQAFVLVFSLIARRERYARHDVERLSLEVAELATARERNRVARELHDSLGHCLTIANVQLEAARAQGPGAQEERLMKAQQVLRDGLAELRNAVTLLREGPPRPLHEALEGLVADTNSAGLPAALELVGDRRALGHGLDLVLYRVAQEALTNARKHARASKVNVSLAFERARVLLAVTDDGAAGEALTEGNGLSGMRERVTQAGGTLTIERAAAGGVALRVEVPAP